MKTHPFAGRMRTVKEIAEICQLTTNQIERYIINGWSIPMTKARQEWLIGQQMTSIYVEPRAAQKGIVGNPGKTIVIDKKTYPSLEKAAKAFGINRKTVERRHAEAKAQGRELTMEDMRRRQTGPRGC